MAGDIRMLVQEVQRLTSEVEHLRGRVAAFESSRWWRFHPRFVARRVVPSRPDLLTEPRPPALQPSASTTHLESRFRAEVFERGAFTHDWFLHQIVPWEPLFSELEGRKTRLLEIGSFEGLSACYALWRLPDTHVTCIDTFEGGVEYAAEDVDTSTLEEVFRNNVALVDDSRVRTIVGDSRHVLVDLVTEQNEFDLVYVDGSHLALAVLIDAALSWQVLVDGGFLVFDDYGWKGLGEDPLLRPGVAIDSFLLLVEGKFELLRNDTQLVIRKTA